MRNYEHESKWEKSKYMRLVIKIDKEKGEKFKYFLTGNGETVQGHIKTYIDEYLKQIHSMNKSITIDSSKHSKSIKESQRAHKAENYKQNMKFLQNNIPTWRWIDEYCDHILINSFLDYYLGKTYWFNRKTKEHGYMMLDKLYFLFMHEINKT